MAFGRGTGTLDEGATIIDIHGAGCQRSDPKDGDAADYPDSGNGPQGDVSRVFNHVRCVRAGATAPAADSDGDGLPDWFEYNYSGSSTAMEAGGNDDGDRASNEDEMNAGTSPVDAGSCFQASVSTLLETEFELQWSSELGKSYTIEVSTDLVTFEEVLSGIEATPPINSQAVPDGGSDSQRFFRVIVE